jgi:hypothetical protein
MRFDIGHPPYRGGNRPASCRTYAAALRELLGRRVAMKDAQRALRAAVLGSHATCRARQYGDVVEVVFRPEIWPDCDMTSWFCVGRRTYGIRTRDLVVIRSGLRTQAPTNAEIVHAARKFGYRLERIPVTGEVHILFPV